MSYCVFECGITYETDFKDTTALYAAITKILSADIRGIEEYWDLDESKRTEEDLKSVHHLMVSAVMDMEWGLDMDIEGLFFDYLTTFKSPNDEYASVEIKRSSEGTADLTEVEEYLVEKLAPLMKDEYSIGYYADSDSKSGLYGSSFVVDKSGNRTGVKALADAVLCR
tara:strand:+ start:79 stop:582 length:504 start_codon:yes stop_codon:yes gene_type:complete